MSVESFVERMKDEVDFDHPWAKEGRIPLIHGFLSSRGRYEVALVVPDEADYWLYPGELLFPTEEEASLVTDYINYRRSYYNQMWQRKMLEYPLDVDSSTNTVYLAKTDKGWVYSRASWQSPPFYPTPSAEKQYPDLAELLDKINTFGDVIYHGWVEWKETRTLPVLPALTH